MLRSLLAALWRRASAAPLDRRAGPRVVSTVSDGLVSRERQAELVEAGRQWRDDVMARTHVERSGHFDVPRFS